MDRNMEIQESILSSIKRLTLDQQIKLLNFINSMIETREEVSNKNNLLKFVGVFEKEDLKEMEDAIEDCEKIDEDEW